jgi:hypothetical protein
MFAVTVLPLWVVAYGMGFVKLFDERGAFIVGELCFLLNFF